MARSSCTACKIGMWVWQWLDLGTGGCLGTHAWRRRQDPLQSEVDGRAAPRDLALHPLFNMLLLKPQSLCWTPVNLFTSKVKQFSLLIFLLKKKKKNHFFYLTKQFSPLIFFLTPFLIKHVGIRVSWVWWIFGWFYIPDIDLCPRIQLFSTHFPSFSEGNMCIIFIIIFLNLWDCLILPFWEFNTVCVVYIFFFLFVLSFLLPLSKYCIWAHDLVRQSHRAGSHYTSYQLIDVGTRC